MSERLLKWSEKTTSEDGTLERTVVHEGTAIGVVAKGKTTYVVVNCLDNCIREVSVKEFRPI